MGRQVNIEEKARLLNDFISKTGTKALTYAELKEGLRCVTSTAAIINNLIKLFPHEKIGRSNMYEMPKQPIYKGLVEKCWNQQRAAVREHHRKTVSPEISEEQAIEKLKSSGFIVRKIIGFDVERFAIEQPELYRKYCKYEYV